MMMMTVLAGMAALGLGAGEAEDAAREDALLHSLFTDHAVIQRGRPISLWGRAEAGAAVRVRLGETETEVEAGANGEWRADLPAMAAGGPHTLSVSSGEIARTAGDVMIGDVWLCSGQSNMALEVSRALNAPAEIAGATDPAIRAMTLPLRAHGAPLTGFSAPAPWVVASPETAASMSAACFFMARELRRVEDVPIGLVVSAWGGSRISAWISAGGLRAAELAADALDRLEDHARDRGAAMAQWGGAWENWWLAQTGETSEAAPWADGLDTSHWNTVPDFTYWEHWGDPELAAHDGMVWYRTEIDLNAEQAAQPAELLLGRVDEVDQTWLNGAPVGGMSGPDIERRYDLPAGRLREGVNTITVNALDTWGVGGMVGPDDARELRFADGSVAPLDGTWRYEKVASGFAHPPRAPWDDTGGYARIANAMIAPLDGYGFKGAAWIQGESDTGHADLYQAKLAALMADWRDRFGADLPFIIVQLANYGPPSSQPFESGWAGVREAQRLAVEADDRAALAVAVDLGDIYDIHPPNKQELARRMARAARHVAYGETDLPPSGPRPVSAVREGEGEAVRVAFADVAGELAALSSQDAIGFELCGTEAGSCRYIHARADGSDVRLEGARAGDARVRFCWADSPVCNLVDADGLPPTPFEMTLQD